MSDFIGPNETVATALATGNTRYASIEFTVSDKIDGT
jgi:hypothetical protein